MGYKKTFSFAAFALVLLLQLVLGAVPVFTSVSVPDSATADVNFNVPFTVTGTSLTQVAIYERTVVDGKSVFNKFTSQVCSGNSCSGTFTIKFSTAGSHQVYLAAVDSAKTIGSYSKVMTINAANCGPSLGQPCNVGVGACLRSGTYVCNAQNNGVVCNAVAGTPSTETCNGIDDDCDSTVDNGGNALCSDSLFCNGAEVCSGVSGCTAGTAVSCIGSNLAAIGTCTNNPDNNPRTWDFFAGFTSTCNEATDSCNTGTVFVTSSCNVSCGGCVQNSDCLPSTCSQTFNDYCSGKKLVEYDSDEILDSTIVSNSASNTCNTGDCSCTSNSVICNAPSTNSYCVLGVCNADCEVSGDCADKCNGNIYSYSGSCSSGCACSYSTTNCDASDGWYNTSTVQWVNDTICNQRKQVLQEYRDYSCSLPSGCSYSTISNRWIDTSEITAKNNGAVCDDGLYCTVSDICTAGVCGGSARSCSGSNIPSIGICTNDPDNNPKTWDFYAGFTSVCDEGTDSCTTGTVTVTSTCNKATCLAQCENSGDCLPSTCSVKYNDSCVSGKLKDYNSDNLLNYRFVNNSVSNTCLSSCSCTANSVSCSEPSSTTTCVKGQCGAACGSSSDCNSYCSGSIYHYSGSCSGSCSCSFASTDCALSNGWYNSSVTQWVSTGDCTEKQQREQKYRTYTCSAGCTYTNTSTQWIDTGSVRNKANGLSCSDGAFCNGLETCQAGICTAGTTVSCTGNNIAPFATCDNVPDSIHATWDFSSGFTSTCDEVNDRCTNGTASITHTCSKTSCSAQCETAGDCGNTCINNVYYTSGSCSGTCSCSYSGSNNCTAKNDWYDTLSDRIWVSTGQCTEKEQKEQEHRTYTCGSGCVPSVDSTRWIDTGATRSITDGTTCNDGLFCTQTDTCSSGTCSGTGNTCAPFNIGAINTCNYIPDNKSNTLDVFSGFTSVCNEGADTCSSGSITITSTCNKATCGAQCESSSDCSASTCSVNYNDVCNGTKLIDYNNNGLNDFVHVSNSILNTCTLSTCGCTNNAVSCFAPVATTHCVKNLCGATCAVNSDCVATDCSAGNICEIGHIYKKYDSVSNTCSASCGCSENSCSGFTELYNVSCNFIPEYALTIPSQNVVQYSYTMLNLKAIPYFGDFDDDPLWITAVSNSTYLKVKMNNATSYANLSSNVSGSYSVIFTAHDGFGGVVSSTPILVSVSRVNLGAPVVTGINLNRSVVYRNTNFTFSYNYTDVDNDAITSYVYRLYKNKVLQYNRSNTNLVKNDISWKKADNLTISLRVCDWSRCSGWNNKTITVADTEMIVTSIYLKPNATVYNNNTLYTCYAKYYDADGDVAGYSDTTHKYVTLIRFKIIKNNLVYFNNDPAITTSNSTQNASYTFSSTSPNDNISCTAYFYKYWGNFSVINPYFNNRSTANVTVLNRAPHIDKIDVSGRNYNDSTNSTFKNSRRVDLTNYVNHTFQVALFSDYFSDPDGYWDMNRYSNLSYTYTDSRTGKTAGFFNCTTWVNGSCTGYRIERISFKSTKLENYNINVTVTDIHGAKDSVVIYVHVIDYRAAPTITCTNQSVSDGWENMGQYVCSCSNNYLDEPDTIKLSNMNVGRNAGNPAVGVNEFNMSVSLLGVKDYDNNVLTELNPFNKTTSTSYAWYPLWKDTRKIFDFNVTCATPKGKVWKSVKVDVDEGYYQFYNSRIMYWDGANVTGYVKSYSNAGIMPSEPIYNVSACILSSTDFWNLMDSDTMMRRLFNTNDLSFIRPNNDYWAGIGINKTGYVDQNSRDYNRLNIRIDDFMTRYNNLNSDYDYYAGRITLDQVQIIKECIDPWQGVYSMNCTKYDVSQCAHKNLTNVSRSSYATDYSVVIKKII